MTVAGVDLTVYTTATLTMLRPDGTSIVKTATIDDAGAGTIHFTWAANDLQAGLSLGDLAFFTAAGLRWTEPSDEPIRFVVRAKVA